MLYRRIGILLLAVMGSVTTGATLIWLNGAAFCPPVVASMSMSLPWQIENTPLIIQAITGYEGAYIEDGSDEEVVDVAALVLYNTGSAMLSQARVIVYTQQGELEFYLTNLPEKSGILVLETHRRPWQPQALLSCQASYTTAPEDSAHSGLRIRQLEGRTLELANMTDEIIDNATLIHKGWSGEIGCYIGGITYQTRLPAIYPGQILLMTPEHYLKGRSKLLGVFLQ